MYIKNEIYDCDYRAKPCPDCRGTGIAYRTAPWLDPAQYEEELCDNCEGKGYIE